MSISEDFSINASSLANGATLATMNIPNCYTTTVSFWVKIGERNEPEHKLGITHTTEHLWVEYFKEEKSNQTLWEMARGFGGACNGLTAPEFTACWLTVPSRHTLEAVSSLASITIDPRFSEDDVRKAADMVTEELREDLDNPGTIASDKMREVWGNNSIGRSDFLAIDVLPNLLKKDVLDYYRQNYAFSNMIIAVAGDINHTEIQDRLSQTLPSKKLALPSFSIEPPKYMRINPPEINMGEGVSLLHIATKGISRCDNRYWTLQCLGLILCSGQLRTRFYEIARQEGLSYDAGLDICYYCDASLLTLYAPFTDDKGQYIQDVAIDQMKSMTKIKPEEIGWAKEQLKTDLLVGLPESENAASYLAESAYYLGNIPEISEVMEQINAVNQESIEKLAEEIMRDELISVVRVSPKV
jgi:predicted Zn-dependent peptidase